MKSITGLFIIGFYACMEVSAQNSISISTPFIFNVVEITDNFGPHQQIGGNAFGYGVNFKCNFRPNILRLNKNLSFKVGVGYFRQQFNLERPFHFDSPIQILYYTDNYSYDNLQWILGLAYKNPLKQKNYLNIELLYNGLNSFRQKYNTSSGGSAQESQIESDRYNYGCIITISTGLQKDIGDDKRYSVGLNLIMPIYTKWRKDSIFDDDPTEYCHPKFSLG